jgi:hypothetical protein
MPIATIFFMVILDQNGRPERTSRYNTVKETLENVVMLTGKENFIVYEGKELYKETEE